jgi:hypothetical protein
MSEHPADSLKQRSRVALALVALLVLLNQFLVLPNLLGSLKQATGSFSGGFLAFALVGGFGRAAALAYASRGWHGTLIGRRDLTLESA